MGWKLSSDGGDGCIGPATFKLQQETYLCGVFYACVSTFHADLNHTIGSVEMHNISEYMQHTGSEYQQSK